MKQLHKLSDLQTAVMRVLWEMGEATVAQVQHRLEPQRALATTTVATLLSRLEKRGVVSYRRDGRLYVYRPAVTEAEVQRSTVSEVTERLFQGDVTALVSQLLDPSRITPGDLARVKKLVEARERELESNHEVSRPAN